MNVLISKDWKSSIANVCDSGLVRGKILTPNESAKIPGHRKRWLQESLLMWFARNRRSFPWRGDTNPWHVLLTEILLRKTNAKTVAQHISKFIELYPDPASLAGASREDLSQQLAPLGLSYQRADQLRALAAAIIHYHNGEVPSSLDELLALPAVGRYSAIATQVFGFGLPGIVLDTNVVRILARIFEIRSAKVEARKDNLFWDVASRLIARDKNAEMNWALLDLGALVCIARDPKCEVCPLQRYCGTGKLLISQTRRLNDLTVESLR